MKAAIDATLRTATPLGQSADTGAGGSMKVTPCDRTSCVVLDLEGNVPACTVGLNGTTLGTFGIWAPDDKGHATSTTQLHAIDATGQDKPCDGTAAHRLRLTGVPESATFLALTDGKQQIFFHLR